MSRTYYDDMIELVESEIRRKEQVRQLWLGKMERETEAVMVAEILNFETIKRLIQKEKPERVREIDGEYYCPKCGAAIDECTENYCTLCGKHLVVEK